MIIFQYRLSDMKKLEEKEKEEAKEIVRSI